MLIHPIFLKRGIGGRFFSITGYNALMNTRYITGEIGFNRAKAYEI